MTDGLAATSAGRLGVTSKEERRFATGSSGFDEVEAASTSGTLRFDGGAKGEGESPNGEQVMYDEYEDGEDDLRAHFLVTHCHQVSAYSACEDPLVSPLQAGADA